MLTIYLLTVLLLTLTLGLPTLALLDARRSRRVTATPRYRVTHAVSPSTPARLTPPAFFAPPVSWGEYGDDGLGDWDTPRDFWYEPAPHDVCDAGEFCDAPFAGAPLLAMHDGQGTWVLSLCRYCQHTGPLAHCA